MTTIAYDHKNQTVSIDSRITNMDMIVNDEHEKFTEYTTPDGSSGIMFFAGAVPDYPKLLDMYLGLIEPDELDCCGVSVEDDGVVRLVLATDRGMMNEVLTYNCTEGSGSKFALSAMDFGKTSAEAIEYTKSRDMYTGGLVRTFDVEGFDWI